MNSAIWGIAPPDRELRRLRAHTAMSALGIDKLCQNATKVLLLGRHAEQNTLGAHVAVETLDIGDSESQFDLSCWVLVRSRVQCESGLACHKLAPTRRFEFHL